jgi:hypothetical protein
MTLSGRRPRYEMEAGTPVQGTLPAGNAKGARFVVEDAGASILFTSWRQDRIHISPIPVSGQLPASDYSEVMAA